MKETQQMPTDKNLRKKAQREPTPTYQKELEYIQG